MPRFDRVLPCSFLLLVLGLTATTPAVAAVRLPTDVVPTYQHIQLRVDADSSSYTGSVRVELDVLQPASQVQLHAEGQKLTRVQLTQKGKAVPVTQARGDQGLLTLTTGQPLAKGPAVLEIAFMHEFNRRAVSLYRMEREGSGYLFTQFEAEHARQAFPCWDEPSFKFPYQLTLEVPTRHSAVFNTPLEREGIKAGWKTLVFKKTPPTPSYLLAIATGPLEYTPIPGMKIPTRVVTVKGQSALTGAAVETTPGLLAACEAYFGQPYPYEKLDLIAVPEYWAGAMENPGAITYADHVLLADPKTASPAHRKNLLRISAHELAHMWFGDLVTMKWWDDLWLNESFADWLGDRIADEAAPQLQHLLTELQNVQLIMETDARPSTDPIRLRAETGSDAMRAVGVAYNKGKAVLTMFEQWMGPEVFQKGVNDYIQAHAWKNAEAADLWSALSKASGKDVTGIMAPFIEQSGIPLVNVEPLPDGSVRLSQRRFLNHGVQAPAHTWQIPMRLSFPEGGQVRTMSVLLGAEPQTVQLAKTAPKWVMPNMGGSGYYRWTLPADMLTTLAQTASLTLTPAERIAFSGNLVALLDAGEIHGDLYLRALSDLARDPEPVVISSVLSGLGKARQAFVPDARREEFSHYVRRMLAPPVERFALEKKSGESETVSLMRPQLMLSMGRDGRDAKTLELAGTIATQHLQDPSRVDPAVAGVALQLHALNGDAALFDRYLTALVDAKNPSVRQRYLMALGSFGDPALEERSLQLTLDDRVRPNEIFNLLGAVGGRSDRSADHALQFLRDHFEKLSARLPREYWTFLAYGGGGCSAERYAIAKDYFSDPARSVQGMPKALAKVGDQVGDCVSLRQREGPAVAAYLKGLVGAN